MTLRQRFTANKNRLKVSGKSMIFLAFFNIVLFRGLCWSYSLIEPPRTVARPDYTLGVVFLEKWNNDVYLGLEDIIPLEEYLNYSIREAVIQAWQEEAHRALEQRELAAEPAGLIPDIMLPQLPILGQGSKIDISGRDRITLGGSQTVLKGVTQTMTGQSLFPELKMEQQLAVTVNGTIGDRTKITIDHDSERDEQQNKIKLQYTGTEDEVLQSVELGDTKLDIPGTIYTGDLPAHHGLFGISAKGKVAGADVYAIASREGSQSQTQTFTGKRRVITDTIWDTEFIQRRFYRLPGVDSVERLLNLRVYVDDKNSGNNQAAVKAIVTVFPDNPDSIVNDNTWWSYDRAGGNFDLKTPGVDYILQPGNILEFVTPIERNHIIGVVVYKEQDTIGGQILRDSLVLCLLKPEVSDSLSRAWELHLRNRYQLRQGDVKLDMIRLFRYDPQGQHYDYETETTSPYFGVPYLQLLELDRNGDGRVEYPEFESRSGIIRFPSNKPFITPLLSVKDSIIYRLDPDFLPPAAGRKYFLVVSYYTITETYALGQTDIIKGSERVVVNGQQKISGTDYSIDYTTGIITFLKPLPPDADIQVTFEYQPWFSFTQKSLLGARTEWTFFEKGKIGSSFFYRNEGILEEKPALGSEPFQRMIAESDISYTTTSDAVTAFLDRLPILSVQSPSRFEFKTEGAVSLPNPNSRGVAYLDDFEGTVVTREITNTAMLWSYASVPVGKDTNKFAKVPLIWITPKDKVRKDSVFGPDIGDEANETQDILRIIFTPDSTELESWAGITTAPSTQLGMNLSDIENLELIVRAKQKVGNIHITVGMAIDEDAPRRNRGGVIKGYNGFLDTEDRNGNGILDEWEDTGLDTVFGEDSLWRTDAIDDGNDDYNAYHNQQGTEGNRRLDAEDLDRNGFSQYNHYFEYTVSLGEQRFLTPLFNGWCLYRLPLRDTTLITKVGNPKWEDIRLVRIWFDGFESADTIELYSLQFVGSKWRNPKITDIYPSHSVPVDTNEKVWVSQVSKKTDTSYTSPFELKRDISGRTETEASLLFGYRSLFRNHQAFVTKTSTSGEDFRDYSEIRFYVHDDGNGLYCFLRLGSDSANYYEVRAPTTKGRKIVGRDGRWYEFVIPLDSLPRLKPQRESLAILPESLYTDAKPDSTLYSILGFPSLANIRWVSLGIANYEKNQVSGGIWFNDIRLTAPKKETGYGLTGQINLLLADFLSLGLRWSHSDPNFRRFSEGRGIKTGGFAQALGGDLRINLDRLLPRHWGISIPVSYMRMRQANLPKFSTTWPDLRVTAHEQRSQIGYGQSQEIALNNLSKQQSGNKLLNYTIEAMNFSWRRRWAANSNYPNRDSSYATGWQCSYGIRPEVKIPLGGDNDLYLLPRDIRMSVAAADRIDIRGDTIRIDTLRGKGLMGNFDIAFSPIDDLTIEYGWDSERDLLVAKPDTIFKLVLGTEANRSENFGVSYDLEIGDIINPSVEFDGEYNHECPKVGNEYANHRNINNSGEISFNTSIDLSELAEKLTARIERTSSLRREDVVGQRLGSRPRSARSPQPDTGGMVDSLHEVSDTLLFGSELEKRRIPRINFASVLGEFAKTIEPIDFNYTISRSSDYLGFSGAAPWSYRLGLSDTFNDNDTLQGQLNRTRDLSRSLRFSSGFGYKEFSARLSYDRTWGKNWALLGATADHNLSWPSIELNLGKVHNLFSNLATDSRLSSSYRRSIGLRGELLPIPTIGETLALFGRIENRTTELNPLLTWQTTWKKRISTTFTVNHSRSAGISYLSETGRNRSLTETRTQGANTSLSYAFSAPQGLKLPFLRKVRFSSDLSLTWQLRYSQTVREQTVWTEMEEKTTVPQQRDNTIATSLGASYRFSRSIEAGLNTGYSYNKSISGISNERSDLNIWILFRF